MSAERHGRIAVLDRLEQLRTIVLGREQRELADLRERLDDPEVRARELARVLPRALDAGRTGTDLPRSLGPVVEDALELSVRRDPERIAAVLSPALGPAVRRAAKNALRDAVDTLDRVLFEWLSPRAIRLRLEARRSGKTFAEVALLASRGHRVEEVLLIEPTSGVLMQHRASPSLEAPRAEVVAALLAAVQPAVQDGLGGAKTAPPTDPIRVGDLVVWIEPGPRAVLAVAVRGEAPPALRSRMETVQEEIHRRFGGALAAFAGDPETLAPLRPVLAELFREEPRGGDIPGRSVARPSSRPFAWAALAVVVALLLGMGFIAHRRNARLATAAERLGSEPGIVVTEASRSGGKYTLRGLRDPLAADPRSLLQSPGLGLDAAAFDLRFLPFVSLEPDLVRRRAQALLEPPPGVSMALRDGALVVEGTAPHRFLAKVKRLALAVPGIAKLDLGGVADEEALAGEKERSAIESTVVVFTQGSADLTAPARTIVGEVASHLVALDRRLAGTGLRVRTSVLGFGDPDAKGGEAGGKIARERALRVATELASSGVDARTLEAGPGGALEPGHALDRLARFRVRFEDEGE